MLDAVTPRFHKAMGLEPSEYCRRLRVARHHAGLRNQDTPSSLRGVPFDQKSAEGLDPSLVG